MGVIERNVGHYLWVEYGLRSSRVWPWWKLSATIVGLTIALAMAGSIAVFLIIFGAKIPAVVSEHTHSTFIQNVIALRVLQWVVMVILLILFCPSLSIRPQFAEP